MAFHYQYVDKYVVSARCSSPLHIGSAMGGKEEVLLHPVDREPFIQSSGIAGVLRNVSAKISREDTERLFGASHFEENTNANDFAGRVKVSDGRFKMDTVKMELRPRVAIDSRTGSVCAKEKEGSGVSAGQKFETEYIGAGAEFSFDVYLYRMEDTGDREMLEQIFGELKAEHIQIGGQKTNGSGYIQLKEILFKEFDMTDPDSRKEWAEEDELPAAAYQSIAGRLCTGNRFGAAYTFTVTARTEGNLLVKGISADAFGKDAPDSVNMRNAGGDFIIPGSSLKGSLRNRMTFIAGNLGKSSLLKEIFGYTGKGRNSGASGRISVKDTVVGNQKDNEAADLQHRIHIDKFTGGVIHGSLFAEKNVHGSLTMEISIQESEHADAAAGLLLLALRDLAAGLMNLGSGYSVGKGYIHVIEIEIRRGEETVLINWEKQEMKGSEQIIHDCLQKLKTSEG